MSTRNKLHLAMVVLLIVGLLAVGCGNQATPTPEPEPTEAEAEAPTEAPTEAPAEEEVQISVAGSTTVQPLTESLAEAYAEEHPNVQIDVQGGGSSVGVKSAGEGTVDIGQASREVKDSEKETYPDLKIYTIARDGIAIAAHPDVSVDGLGKDEVRQIFAGEITNWSEVGGSDANITVVAREEGSGTRGAFEDMVMGESVIADTALLQPSNGAVKTTVSTTPNAIGFLSFGYLDESVKALAVEGAEPTVANAVSGEYPVVRPLNMMTGGEPTGAVNDFLDFIMSEEGQKVVAEEYIPVQ
ncbi:MAG: phosphate ABC transporter substrate-binding protein [Anaerolineae bacterium]